MKKIFKLFIILIALAFTASCQSPPKEGDGLVLDAKGQDSLPDIEEEEAPPPPVTTNVSMSVVGDIMVHSYQYEEAYDPGTKTYDFSHNFSDVKKYFDASDITIGNIETVFAGEKAGIGDYPMFNTPDSFAQALKEAGFDVLTTANNHSMDRYKAGAIRTIDVLDELGRAYGHI